MGLLSHTALALLAAANAAEAALEIVPGATWTATGTGRHIQAHGAGITEVDGKYYMIGEDKSSGGEFFESLGCYSSDNLVEWTYEGAPLKRTEDGDLGPERIVERPKVIYNEPTNKYVMYFHLEDENRDENRVGVAVSDEVCGEFEYLGGFRPLDYESRDIGMFKDEDGSAYLMSEDRDNGLRMFALSDDYLNVTETVHVWPEHYESPAILKRDGYYFIFGSQLSGWNPNDNLYSYSESLDGDWADWEYFAPEGTNTFQSQTTVVLPIGKDTVIYMGDRWDSENLMRSSYIWLPLQISDTDVSLEWYDSWTLDIDSGEWGPNPAHDTYEAEDATLSNDAESYDCDECSEGSAVGELGTVQFDWTGSASDRGTIVITHINDGDDQLWANVTCNGVVQTIALLPAGDEDTGNSTVHCDLAEGNNTLIITGEDEEETADIDKISVPSE